ncbi:MAG: DUF835 domain-containing protein [Candidatus Thermoplasmatota archaeon]|nr:DUF835 domain-containing protein [Candidatus Thermoplasmatota archaeon]
MVDIVSMPVNILKHLRKTIEETGSEEEADYAVYQLGNKWGKETVCMGDTESTLDELSTKAALVAIHSGILKIDMTVQGETIRIESHESRIDDDYFIAGYLAGIISTLLRERYVANVKDGYYELVKPEQQEKEVVSREEAEEKEKLGTENLERGESYLISEDAKLSPIAFDLFFEGIENGIPGLCITRIFPPKIKDESYEEEFPVFWLTTMDAGADINTIEPSEYDDKLFKIMETFLKSRQGIIILHGSEFLISNNEFEEVLNFVQKVRDVTSMHNGIFLFSVSKKSLSDRDFGNLKSELTLYEG